MAAPSVGRQSRQRQGVALYEGIKNGGLDLFKAAERLSVGHGDYLLNDGFFSFAVVRQVIKLLCFLFCPQKFKRRLVNKLPDYLSLLSC